MIETGQLSVIESTEDARERLLITPDQPTRDAFDTEREPHPSKNVALNRLPETTAYGHIDVANHNEIAGWAWNPDDPNETLQIEIYENTDLLARIDACQFRSDLPGAGIGTGRYGFKLHGIGNIVSPGPTVISVVLAKNKKHLRGSPQLLDSADTEFTARERRRIDLLVNPLIEGATDAAQLAELFDFLHTQLRRVIEARTRLAAAKSDPIAALIARKAASSLEIWSAETTRFLGEVARKYPVLGVPAETDPRVSIIIPCHNNFEFTYRCIESILNTTPHAPFEIVIVDDGSIDETMLAELLFIGAVRVVRHATALGFLRAANAGAAVAGGDLLLFLNNDTTLREDALDEMVRTFDTLPNIGIVGSKLINTDGTLQEAGGVVQRLGNAMNWGFGANPDDPKYCYLRDADYVSGASLMIPRALFKSVQGFDERYEPGYYEDTDLCFKVRQAGARVVVQPLSKVVHHGGATAGTSTTQNSPKRYQNINQRKFLRRWDAVLADDHNAATFPERDAERRVTRRAVFIDDTVPTPDRDGGSNVAWTHMRMLGQLGFKVGFIPANNMLNISPYTADLQRVGIECFYAPFTGSLENAFRQMAQTPPDLIYFHRITNAAPYLPLARKMFPSARLVYSVADLHFLRLARQAALEDRQDLRARAEIVEREELQAAAAADFVIVHSAHEVAILRDRVPGARVSVVQWPFTAVDAAPDLRERSGVAFVGGYGHEPNVDAALRLANHIMPLVHRQLPGLPLHLVGAEAPRSVRDLASGVVKVVGHAPDLAHALRGVLCTAAPLRYGAGVKVKVLTSLALGLPCVMSEVAAEGIALPESLAWLVACSEAEMAERIVALHQAPELAERLSHNGINFVRTHYRAAVILQQFAAAIGEQVDPRQ
jgi:GT2 family glycosyltransferase/glycosyltransferase involved in cell wall biosynthesis